MWRAPRNSACHTHCLKITRCGGKGGIAVLGILMFLVAALPAAHAPIVPVNFVHETAGDSKILSGVVLAPLPHNELRRAVKPALPKSFFVLSAGVYTAAGLGMQLSESCCRTSTRGILSHVRFCGCPRRRITLLRLCSSRQSTLWVARRRGRRAGAKSGGFRK